MSDNELVFAILLLVFLPVILLRMTLKYRERRLKALGDASTRGNSLTTTELEVLIEDAVRRGTARLEDRLDRLEHAVFGEGTVDATLSLEDFDDEDAEDLGKTVGRINRPRVR